LILLVIEPDHPANLLACLAMLAHKQACTDQNGDSVAKEIAESSSGSRKNSSRIFRRDFCSGSCSGNLKGLF